MIVKESGSVLKANGGFSSRRCSPFVVWGDRRRIDLAITRRECAHYPAYLFFQVHPGATRSALTDPMSKEALHVDAATCRTEIAYWEVTSRRRVLRKGGEKRKRK